MEDKKQTVNVEIEERINIVYIYSNPVKSYVVRINLLPVNT